MARDRARRRGGRDGGAVASRGGFQQPPKRQLRNPYKPIEVLSEDQLDRIHAASMQVCETIGIMFMDAEALRILEAGGAIVEHDTQRVRLGRDMIEDLVAKAPSTWTLRAPDPANDREIGGNAINIAMVASAPNSSCRDRGRRVGNFEDFCNFVRLGHSLNICHQFGGFPVEPQDLAPETRHLDTLHAFLTLTDKAPYVYALGAQRIEDALDMMAIRFGTDRDGMRDICALQSVINTSSPLRVDGPMLQGLMALARNRQAAVITPFTLSGAMSPATIAGALVMQNAEALATIAFQQLVQPGAPVLYGGFTSNVDMKSGAPAFGTPEYAKAALAGGQLARRYNLPYRSSNANASNIEDAQAAYESQTSIWAAVMGHANLIKHGLGWQEGGLVASFEKVMLDAEMLQMMGEFLQPLVVDDDTMALDAIAEVGHGGHFFGVGHTLERYETAFYSPILSDWRNFESWREAGAPDAATRATALWKQVLADYEPPPLDPAVDEALQAYVAQAKRRPGAA